jgi:hypothetical protein
MTADGYFGFMQQIAIDTSGTALNQYIAGLSGAVGGVDVHIGAPLTSYTTIEPDSDDASGTMRQINLFTQYLTVTGDVTSAVDVGTPGLFGETREDIDIAILITAANNKMYPHIADRGSLGSVGAAGTDIDGFFFESLHNMADHENEVVSSVFLGPDGETYRAVAFRDAVEDVFIEMPPETLGRQVEIQTADSHASFEVHRGGMIDADGVLVSAPAGGHAYLKVV